MTTIIDNELWDELRTDIPPGPHASLTDEDLKRRCISLMREAVDPRSWNPDAKAAAKVMILEMKLRGFNPHVEFLNLYDGKGRPRQ